MGVVREKSLLNFYYTFTYLLSDKQQEMEEQEQEMEEQEQEMEEQEREDTGGKWGKCSTGSWSL